MSTNPPGVVVVGSINADLVVTLERHPQPGETVLGRSMTVLPGGKGANQAVAAARLGAPVTLIGAVGRDAYADAALAGLRSAGVRLALRHADAGTGVALVQVSVSGENSIVVIPGANAEVIREVVESQASLISEASVLVLQGEIPAESIAEAVRHAQGRVMINLAPVIDIDRSALLAADPLVVNEHEGILVLEQLGVRDLPTAADHRRIIEALSAAGFASVVLTLGAEGAMVASNGTVEHFPAPKVSAVDTTGAGDAFVGALAARLAAGDSLVSGVGFAVRVGAYAVRSEGAQPSYPALGDELPGDGVSTREGAIE
ncbi:ribokinase [Arthrobacter crusticola]|uniref:Ribokinase n=1 Tax=Arthrobacter crusticola TaxID=2547960 RepID=A0A4R5TUS2_9MICC|nr:ribokinase [Arthrobacter crusticola]TDK24802.1 ribokinase [Arthrobacter crusticola]